MILLTLPAVLLALLPLATVSAAPEPEQTQTRLPTKTYQRRGIISDVASRIDSEVGSQVNSVLSSLGSAIPSYVAAGVANFFQDLPQGAAVQSRLGLSDEEVQALPTQVLNLPSYGNLTDHGWNLRFRGNVYKQPNISESTLNGLANIFLINTSVQSLPPLQAAQARNLTAEIFVIQQGNENVTFNIALAGASGEKGGGANQTIHFPTPTTPEGDFDGFVQINDTGLAAGNSTSEIQRMNVYTKGDIHGNATAYLLPTTGLTIISDIDDILRVTRIYQPADGLLNSFARAFIPWVNMPDIYANWSRSVPNLHFHYLTTTPEQATRNYMDFIYKTYPAGSFDTRPLNFSDVNATLSIRKFLLNKIFETYPKRKFVLVADTSNSDVMRDYPAMAKEFPGQVQCIFLRNTSSTDSGDRFPYDTSGFQGLDNSTYMFFNVPDDLKNLDISRGHCRNSTIMQNITFSYQGLPFGFSMNSAAALKSNPISALKGLFSGVGDALHQIRSWKRSF